MAINIWFVYVKELIELRSVCLMGITDNSYRN